MTDYFYRINPGTSLMETRMSDPRSVAPMQWGTLILASVALTTATALPAQTVDHGQHAAPVLLAQAEGGEGGERTGNSDVDLMTNLALMKGHLIVAKELITEKQYKQAVPHIGHPVEEIYGDVEAELTQRQLPQFKAALNQMSDLIKSSPESPELKTAYADSLKAIDATIAAIPDRQRTSPAFVMQVISGLLNTAADEYQAAIVDGKFVEIVEYQDSRGFVLYAEELYKTAPQPDVAKNMAIMQALADLKTAWPTVNPPASPVKPPEAVAQLVKSIVTENVAIKHKH
ncbi:MAG: hypothetical protein HC805_01765 [Alkalinema sp. RL_2_19]|nr:hypothetical protein [Alkalinema sp. RL_2_19]